MKKLMFFLSEEEAARVEPILYSIRAADCTFAYKFYRLSSEPNKFLLVVACKDENEAHRRGMWLRDKLFGNSKLYFVK